MAKKNYYNTRKKSFFPSLLPKSKRRDAHTLKHDERDEGRNDENEEEREEEGEGEEGEEGEEKGEEGEEIFRFFTFLFLCYYCGLFERQKMTWLGAVERGLKKLINRLTPKTCF